MKQPTKTVIHYSVSATVSTGAYESQRPSIGFTKEFDGALLASEFDACYEGMKARVDSLLEEKIREIKS